MISSTLSTLKFSSKFFVQPKFFSDKCKTKTPAKNGNEKPNQTLHTETTTAINKQISYELNASYAYLSMATYFKRSDVHLPGCHKFFMLQAQEEVEHAQIFIDYLTMRKGLVRFDDVKAGGKEDWGGVLNAFNVTLDMEVDIKEKLVRLLDIAEKHREFTLSDLLVNYFLIDQEMTINQLTNFITQQKRMGTDCGLAVHLFDRELLKNCEKPTSKQEYPKF